MDMHTTYSYFSSEPDWFNSSCHNSTECSDNSNFREPDYQSMAFSLDSSMNPLTVPVNGYIAPLLVVFTIITNSLICIVLLKRHMRNPTNSMLVAMALSDMLTGVFPVPCFLFFFTMGHYVEFVPSNWCYLYNVLTDTVPTIFHTASIWLTVGLAVQRYIYVCHSLKAKQWCSIPNVIKSVVIVYIIAIITQLGRFIDSEYIPGEIRSRIDPNKNVTGCIIAFVPFVENHTNAYFNVYYWFRIICVHMLPCLSLVILNSMLVETIHTSQRRRKMLLKQHRNTEGRKLKESNCTTLMMVAVVGLFLVVELPSGVLFIIMVVQNTFSLNIISEEKTSVTTLIFNSFILLSYPVNFFIYCGMSRQFRNTFKRLFIPGSMPLDREHSQYMSLACENGATKPTKTVETHI